MHRIVTGEARNDVSPGVGAAAWTLVPSIVGNGMGDRIIYLSWPAAEISGGIKMAFRHVELLRQGGFDAVVATRDGQPPTWFETTAPVGDLSIVTPNDVLVFPENHHGLLQSFAGHSGRKVVFCQNHYMVPRGLGGAADYAAFGVSAILSVSRQVTNYCERRFPALPVWFLPVVIDDRVFHFHPHKTLQIVYAPRKRPQEAACIRDLFQAAPPALRRIPWVEIAGLHETLVAQQLKKSAVYLSLCRYEAFALSILEAFACGCIVAGFTGQGAREYVTESNGFWAAEDDCLDCARQLRRALQMASGAGPRCSEMLEAAQWTARQYAFPRLARRLAEFWERFLDAPARSPAASREPPAIEEDIAE